LVTEGDTLPSLSWDPHRLQKLESAGFSVRQFGQFFAIFFPDKVIFYHLAESDVNFDGFGGSREIQEILNSLG